MKKSQSKVFARLIFTFVFLIASHPSAALARTTIQQLLSRAEPGETIKLPAGTFIEDVVIPQNVSIVGANVDKTIIVGSLEASSTENSTTNVSRVTLLHPGSRSTAAVSIKRGNLDLHNSLIISEGGFAAVNVTGGAKARIRNNIIVGPAGDYAIFGRDGVNLEIVNNTIVVQGFGVGLMDKSFAAIRNCLFYGTKPAVIRTDSDYSISYTNIASSGGSFYFNHDLINGNVRLRDAANYPQNPTPADLSNKDAAKYDSLGLTFFKQQIFKSRSAKEFELNQPEFAKNAGSPDKADNNADGSRNTLGAFGGALGNKWH